MTRDRNKEYQEIFDTKFKQPNSNRNFPHKSGIDQRPKPQL